MRLRKRMLADLDQDIRDHIERETQDNIDRGMDPKEARYAALRKFGNVTRVMEDTREVWIFRWLDNLVQDIRFGARMLRKNPGFTAIAILTLALGIGANSAIFSAVNGILIKPLLYADSDRLVQIESAHRGPTSLSSGFLLEAISIPAARDIQAQCPAFGQVGVYGLAGSATMLGGSVPDDVSTLGVDGNFFTILGVRPLLGRAILPADAEPENDRVAVLDYALWNRDFGGDPGVVGKTINLGKTPTTIVGVMPPGFRLGMNGPGLWMPLVGWNSATDRGVHMFSVVARLRVSTTLEAANAQLKTLAAGLAAAYPKTDKGWELSAKSAKEELVGPVHTELLLLLAAVGLVLLIACINVSGMLLTRTWARHREVAIREMLGASRLRIIRQFLAESLLLSLTGGTLGLLVAFWAIPLVRAIAPPQTPRVSGIRLDSNVLLFTLAVSLLTGILFGLAPALRTSGHRIGAALKGGLGGLLAGFSTRGPRRLRSALVIAELALAVILVAGATLVARSLQKMTSVPLGYRTDHVLTVSASIYGSGCDFQHHQPCQLVLEEMLRRIQALHGVKSAAVGSGVPLRGGYVTQGIETEGQTVPKSWNGWIGLNMVTPAYFEVLGIPLLAGRDFTNSDTNSSQRVAIVNQAFAQRFLQGASPLGQGISMSKDKNGQPKWMQVVGEVGDTRDNAITEAPRPAFYVPLTQDIPARSPTFMVRTSANPLAMADAVEHQIWAVEKDAPIIRLTTMDQIVSDEVADPRFQAVLLGSFGALGLILAMVGIYGVISYGVTLRTHEIGVRMALGATRADALLMAVREGMAPTSVGVVVGTAGALALTRFLRSMLFEVKPTDPVTFVGVAALLFIVALAACYVPARRAMRVDPMVALRYE